MKTSILVLGGTAEAIAHTQELIAKNIDQRIIYSLAGRTTNQPNLDCEIRIGGFGGVDGMIKFITENHVIKIIDATHPYALQITENAKQAKRKTRAEYVSILRPEWEKHESDSWIEVSSVIEAIDAIPKTSRVFLALGKQHIDAFSKRADCHFLIRMVNEPDGKLNFTSYEVITGIPNSSVENEMKLIKKHEIQILVSRNSGGEQSYRKIAAARKLEIPVIMINRPN